MFKLYSKGCQHALLALSYVVVDDEEELFQVKDICEKADIPEPFTRKAFQLLVQAGILSTQRGPGGGYTLTRPADEISLLEVIRAIDGDVAFDECILGFPECGSIDPCPLHEFWAGTKEMLIDKLTHESLADISKLAVERDREKLKRRAN